MKRENYNFEILPTLLPLTKTYKIIEILKREHQELKPEIGLKQHRVFIDKTVDIRDEVISFEITSDKGIRINKHYHIRNLRVLPYKVFGAKNFDPFWINAKQTKKLQKVLLDYRGTTKGLKEYVEENPISF